MFIWVSSGLLFLVDDPGLLAKALAMTSEEKRLYAAVNALKDASSKQSSSI